MKIKVEPLLPTGNYLNCRIGIEEDFPFDVNIETAVNQLWDCITAIHMKRYPHLYTPEGNPKYELLPQDDEMRGTHVRDVVEENPSIKAIKEEMLACTKISETNAKGVEIGLMAYAGAASKYPELNETYLSMLEKLGGLQTYSK